MVKVIILRGVSGSGKSTYAKANYPDAIVLSSDDYWIQLDPFKTYEENFDPKLLGYAHGWNLKRYINFLAGNLPGKELTLVVDNTNTTIAEIAPYYAVAQAYLADVEIVTIDVLPAIALKRNTHGVPRLAHAAQVERLYATNAAFPRYWNHQILYGDVETIRKGE